MELNSVYHCTALNLLNSLPCAPNAIISDWMYGVKRQRYGKWYDAADGPVKHWNYHQPMLTACRRVLRPGGVLAIGQSWKFKEYFEDWFGPYRLWTPIWSAQGLNYTPNGWIVQSKEQHPVELRYPNDVIFRTDRKAYVQAKQLHSCPKSVEEMSWLIWQLGLQPGDIVIDCCCGIGTTLVAGRQMGLNVLGCDINLAYVKVARERLANV